MTWSRPASLAAGAALVVAPMGWYFLAGPPTVAAGGALPPTHSVRVARVDEAPLTTIARLYGQVRAQDRATAAFTVGGRVASRPAQVGAAVRAGDILARLDPLPTAHAERAARLQVDALESERSQALADRRRVRALDATGAVAPAERERVETQVQVLESSLARAQVAAAEARRQAAEAVLRAPFDGVIAAVFADPGDTVGAGAPIVAVAGVGDEVLLEAPESVWAQMEGATVAAVRLPATGCAVEGATLRGVGRATAGSGQLFEILVALPSSSGCPIAPGVGAEVDLLVPASFALSVPVGAVLDPTGEGASVLRVREGRVERISVVPTGLHDGRARVRGALEPGDEIVVAGLLGLVPGDRVEVIR